jgi:hypothetical protein
MLWNKRWIVCDLESTELCLEPPQTLRSLSSRGMAAQLGRPEGKVAWEIAVSGIPARRKA